MAKHAADKRKNGKVGKNGTTHPIKPISAETHPTAIYIFFIHSPDVIICRTASYVDRYYLTKAARRYIMFTTR